jgi:ribonucleotide reductase alpha subunit
MAIKVKETAIPKAFMAVIACLPVLEISAAAAAQKGSAPCMVRIVARSRPRRSDEPHTAGQNAG